MSCCAAEEVADPAAAANGLQDDMAVGDNRELRDDNTAQKLGADEIQRLKQEGWRISA